VDFRTRFPLRLGRPGIDEEVDTELEFHLTMRTRELMAQGLSEADARRAAIDRFGDLTRARRECRAIGHEREQHMRLIQYLSELRQDALFAARQMFSTPGFSLVALLTLALGIGATTAIFSVVHAVVLRPLPVTSPDRLVVVSSGWRDGLMSVAPAHYLHLAAEQQAFASVAAFERSNFTLARSEGAERILGARVTGDFFTVFGAEAALGRVFGPGEDQPGRDAVVVLSDRLWRRQFGGDRAIVGREITVNGRPHIVLGVMPASFDFTSSREELWLPIAYSPDRRNNRTNHTLTVYARLRDGVSVAQAAAQMPAIVQNRLKAYPNESAERTLHVTPLMELFVGDYRERLLVLLASVGLVLLIACGNVSNLLLARGTARARELAVRSALGAGQGRLVRQLFTESLILGLVSASAGVVVAHGLVRALVAFGPIDVPRLDQARIDGTVLAFAALIAVLASIVFGLVPAWRTARADVQSTLKEAGRGAGSRGARDIVRSALITTEVALALVLLVGAGLLIRTALEMQRIDIGFDPRGVFTGRLLVPATRYQDAGSMLRLATELEESVSRIPGVTNAAIASTVPFVRGFSNGLLPEGKALDLQNVTQSDGVMVSVNYFETLGLRIVEGRAFSTQDRMGSPPVVILSRTAAQQMWPGEAALGKKLTSANPMGATEVIGIADDVRLGGPSEPAPPTFYVPYAQMNDEAWSWSRAPYVLLRGAAGDAALGSSVRKVVSSVDPAIPLYSMQTLEQRMAATVETARFNTMLLSILGMTGLVLAAVGIYGVIAYFATQRTAEIGIRMALGASRRDVVRLVVRQAAMPVLCGIGLGMLGAIFATRAIATQLVNVTATDPLTFAMVAAVLLGVALVAAIIPARRASKLDPSRALLAT
jgi:putative ABC transport system permease protein